MPWEIADHTHPDRAGTRYHELARASEAVERTDPRDRFYIRWVGEGEPTDGLVPMMGWQDCRYVYVDTDGEMGDIYECLTHPGYTTIGHDVSCEGAAIAHDRRGGGDA